MSIKSEKSEIRNTGVIKFYLKDKGYGFITDDDKVNEYFFHISGTEEKELQKDEKVSFTLETGSRGVKAIDVKRS
jgi:cold shock protein